MQVFETVLVYCCIICYGHKVRYRDNAREQKGVEVKPTVNINIPLPIGVHVALRIKAVTMGITMKELIIKMLSEDKKDE